MADAEQLKADSAYLAGDLIDQLAAAEDAFSAPATSLLKFHGIYQQDDRDVRKDRQRAGLGRATSMMVRASIPGGVLTAEQYLACDALADEVSNGTLRITTRQGLQWHVVGKHDLPTLIGTLNQHLLTTLAACGDVVRNVCSTPSPLPGRDVMLEAARELAVAVRPRTPSYWDLWLDGERAVSAVPPEDAPVTGDSGDATEPLYGPTYLPRKFKIGFAYPGDNSVDVYTNDLGVVPRFTVDGAIDAFTVLVGGGLGMTHNRPATFPRLADPLATVARDELVEVAEAIIAVQRDHGDRDDRKHARMKYLIEDRGLDWFRSEVEARIGRRLDPPQELTWDETSDDLGWHAQTVVSRAGRQVPDESGPWFLGVPVVSGRIQDVGEVQLRSVVRSLVRDHGYGVRFTARQDLLLTDIPADARDEVARRLRDAGVQLVEDIPPVTRHALACPALPTCGLALAEAERAMPEVTSKLAGAADELGLGDEPLHLRVTGCPNGCARPYSTEIGVVGRGKDHYTVHLGGDADGTRLNTQWADRVHLDDLTAVLTPLLAAWRDEREDGEAFGDWCDRVGPATLRERFPSDAATNESATVRASA